MPSASPGKMLRRRTFLVFVVTLLASAALIAHLTIRAFRQRGEALRTATAWNARLLRERLTAELDRRTRALAQSCLRETVAKLGSGFRAGDRPRETARLRALFESIRARHPVALGFFVIAGEVVVFPRVRPPAARGLAPAAGYPRFEELSTAAENQELWLRKPEFALDTYRAAKELDVPPPLKALAEARIAHCLQKLGRTAEARRQYQIVWERYGGEYDPSCPALFRTGSSSEAPGRFRY